MNPKQGKRAVASMGRDWLVNELHHAGIETAYSGDDLIDLLAYTDGDSSQPIPLQILALSERAFSVNRKYSEVVGLLLVYVWNLQSEEPVETYAMNYHEAVGLAHMMGWTKTVSWKRGYYVTNKPSEKLLALLQPFRMTPAKWQERIRGR